MATTDIMGPARNRVDGRLKVTGAAKYSVEFDVPNCAYAWPVESNIAKGKILSIDAGAAEKAPGVLVVLTHRNIPKPKNAQASEERNSGKGIRNKHRLPLSDDEVHYAGQYVAIVVARTIEQARSASQLVRVHFAPEQPVLEMKNSSDAKKPDKNHGAPVQLSKGDLEAALKKDGIVRIEQTYVTPVETHNPIEMSGTIAVWEAEDKLTLYDATQFVKGVQSILSRAWNLPLENVRVICPFVGGAFGCKGAVWPHVLIAAMAAKAAGVPVKFHVPRKFMFTSAGHRPETRQRVSLAATSDGKLQAMEHVSGTSSATAGEYVESAGPRSTGIMYNSPVIRVEETVYPLNMGTPTFMRAPGECPGTYALECALDELAYALKMDPVALRLVNHADNHPLKNLPFSAKHLKECYSVGAERFGWSKRNATPGSMRDNDLVVGWGMATATYPAHKMEAAAKVQLRNDGSATVQCAAHDLGTGAYTALTQISSVQLGIPFEKVTFKLGKSDYPFGPVAGGSNTTGTVGTAIHEVAQLLHHSLADLAVKDSQSPLYNLNADDIAMVAPGRIGLKDDTRKSDGFTDIM